VLLDNPVMVALRLSPRKMVSLLPDTVAYNSIYIGCLHYNAASILQLAAVSVQAAAIYDIPTDSYISALLTAIAAL